MAGNRNNIVRFRRRPKAAALIFIIVLVYIIAFVWLYTSKAKVRTYEVYTGALSEDSVFTGIAARTENVFNSSYNGNVNYYLREGTRAKVADIIYTVDETGRVSELLTQLSNSDSNSLSDENLKIIKSTLNNFKTEYDGNDFNKVYDLKTDINSTVLQSLNENIMANLDSIVSSTGSQNLFRTVQSEQSGVVVYSVDGYEGITDDMLSKDLFDKEKYSKNNLKAQSIINMGNPAYKMISNEEWNIYIPLTQENIDQYDLSNKTSVQIRFVKDDVTTGANFAMIHKDSEIYGKLTLNKYMIRYATDRFLDIELQTSSVTGLKIPITSMVEKSFYTIPKEYLTTGGNSSNYGFICEHYVNNQLIQEFVPADIYTTENDLCYVDTESFSVGDTLIKPNSTDRYPIGPTALLKGVYCVNTGYTVFKYIEIMDQNKEYCIVKKGTSYGISTYDHIILDAQNISENQMIY